jgi:hypothetical protein
MVCKAVWLHQNVEKYKGCISFALAVKYTASAMIEPRALVRHYWTDISEPWTDIGEP